MRDSIPEIEQLRAANEALAREVEEGRRELAEVLEQQAATGRVLAMISRAPAEVKPVFETIAGAALELCQAVSANVFTFDGSLLHAVALRIRDPQWRAAIERIFPQPPSRELVACRAVLEGRLVAIPDVLADPDYVHKEAAVAAGFRSVLGLPLLREGRPVGAIAVGRPQPGPFPRRLLDLLQTFADQAVIAIENARMIDALRREVEGHRRARATIRELVVGESDSRVDIGESSAWQAVRERIAQVAPTPAAVLITGETGTGKEMVARAIHAQGGRADKAMIRLNCAAIPRELVDSELFGHEKGAFTGAVQQRRGRFELADGGTLFLDEVGELPLEVQPRLLRVLQEGEYERVGGERSLRCDVRVIAATNRDLQAAVQAGRFRADLFYRLNVFPIALPPLRERREDIPALVRHFVAGFARRLGRPVPALAPSFIEAAVREPWPGNVRELEHWVERAMICSAGDILSAAPRGSEGRVAEDAPPSASASSLEAVERAHIEQVLARVGWRIEGQGGAADLLGLNASTLRGRMRKLGLRKPA